MKRETAEQVIDHCNTYVFCVGCTYSLSNGDCIFHFNTIGDTEWPGMYRDNVDEFLELLRYDEKVFRKCRLELKLNNI